MRTLNPNYNINMIFVLQVRTIYIDMLFRPVWFLITQGFSSKSGFRPIPCPKKKGLLQQFCLIISQSHRWELHYHTSRRIWQVQIYVNVLNNGKSQLATPLRYHTYFSFHLRSSAALKLQRASGKKYIIYGIIFIVRSQISFNTEHTLGFSVRMLPKCAYKVC